MLDGTRIGKTIFRAADEKDTTAILTTIDDVIVDRNCNFASVVVACCMFLGREIADAPPDLGLREGIIELLKKCADAATETAEEDNE